MERGKTNNSSSSSILNNDGSINVNLLQREIVQEVKKDKTYRAEDAMKKRVVHTSRDYTEFQNFVKCSQQTPVNKQELSQLFQPSTATTTNTTTNPNTRSNISKNKSFQNTSSSSSSKCYKVQQRNKKQEAQRLQKEWSMMQPGNCIESTENMYIVDVDKKCKNSSSNSNNNKKKKKNGKKTKEKSQHSKKIEKQQTNKTTKKKNVPSVVEFEQDFFSTCIDPPCAARYIASSTLLVVDSNHHYKHDKDNEKEEENVNNTNNEEEKNSCSKKKRYKFQIHPNDVVSIYQVEINPDVLGRILESLAHLVTAVTTACLPSSSSSLFLVENDGERNESCDKAKNMERDDTFLNILAPLFTKHSDDDDDDDNYGIENTAIEKQLHPRTNLTFAKILLCLFLFQWMNAMTQCGRFNLNCMFLSTQQKKAAEIVLLFLEDHLFLFDLDDDDHNCTMKHNKEEGTKDKMIDRDNDYEWWKKQNCCCCCCDDDDDEKAIQYDKKDVERLKKLYLS